MEPWNVPMHLCVCMCVCVCVCVCVRLYVCNYVFYDGLQDCLYVELSCNSWQFASFSINFCTYNDTWSTGPNLSTSWTETETTPKRQRGAHDGTEPASVADILMEYSSDRSSTENCLRELRSVYVPNIIQNICYSGTCMFPGMLN